MEAPKERYIRWQGIRITQLGYVIDLFLGFSTASLGFALSLLKDASFPASDWQRTFFTPSLFILVFSIACGVFCVLTRLTDIRKTANLVRHGGNESDRLQLRELGNRTWCLFYLQVGSFTLAILLLFVAVLIAHNVQVF